MRSVDDIPMAIRSDVIMTLVVVKILDFIILSQVILFEEYFGCSVFFYQKVLIFIVDIYVIKHLRNLV